jgi:hypothetical protein
LIFSARIYPRAAVESAVTAFGDICRIRVEDVPEGTRAVVDLPEGAGDDVVGEFCNIALAAAVELQLAPRR